MAPTETEIGGPPSIGDGGRSLLSSGCPSADTLAVRRPFCIAFISMLSAVVQRRTCRLSLPPDPRPLAGAPLAGISRAGAPRRPPRRLLRGDSTSADEELAACAMCRMSTLSAVSFRSSRWPPPPFSFVSFLGDTGGDAGSVAMMVVCESAVE